jgi:glycosyltransferase involved in cell wall biosynthesis
MDLIAEVAGRFASSNSNGAHFIFAGDGPRYASFAKTAGRLPNVTLTGWLEESDIRYLLSISHVGLLPWRSVRDAMPNKLFDYLSAGLPVISSLEGEAAQILAECDAGLSYRCGDQQTLYDHISRLTHDSLLRERQARNARDLFERRFRSDVVYGKYADYLEKINNEVQNSQPARG